MKIVIVNGSPRGQKSNSIRLSRAFVEGLGRVCPVECEELTLSEMNIEPCIGCLNCWKRTPGKCFKTDDAGPAIEKVMQATKEMAKHATHARGGKRRGKAETQNHSTESN